MTNRRRVVDAYRAANLAAARIIAADQVRFPPGSLPAVWAQMIIERAVRSVDGPLVNSEQRAA